MNWNYALSRQDFDIAVNIWADTSASRNKFVVRTSKIPAQTPDTGFAFAFEDLQEIFEAAEHWEESGEHGLPPAISALTYAREVLTSVAGLFPAPEITTREHGTILMLWHDDSGFISIEIGGSEFGLISAKSGYPSVRINGMNNDLMNQIPRHYQSLTSRGTLPSQVSTGVIESFRDLTQSAISRIMSDFGRSAPAI